MADGIEKEELGNNKSLHQHHRAGSDDGDEADYVHHPDRIEDDIPWTSQRAFNERHFQAGEFEKVVRMVTQ